MPQIKDNKEYCTDINTKGITVSLDKKSWNANDNYYKSLVEYDSDDENIEELFNDDVHKNENYIEKKSKCIKPNLICNWKKIIKKI